jgi:uncharacterized membrane protein YeaQ/YmgE (transglycosylase-associated protein family)
LLKNCSVTASIPLQSHDPYRSPILLIIAGICGGVGQSIAGNSRAGCFGSIALGFIGALLGLWIARALKLPEPFSLHIRNGGSFPIVWSIAGAALFVAFLGLLNRGREP